MKSLIFDSFFFFFFFFSCLPAILYSAFPSFLSCRNVSVIETAEQFGYLSYSSVGLRFDPFKPASVRPLCLSRLSSSGETEWVVGISSFADSSVSRCDFH